MVGYGQSFPLPRLPSVGHTLTSTHSGPAPRPPLLLFLWQIVSFSDLPDDFSLALPQAFELSDSRTVIDPDTVNVLFLVAFEFDA